MKKPMGFTNFSGALNVAMCVKVQECTRWAQKPVVSMVWAFNRRSGYTVARLFSAMKRAASSLYL